MRKTHLWTFWAEEAEKKMGVKANGQVRSLGHIPLKFTKKDAG